VTVIDGEVWQPSSTWSCPSCSRRHPVDPGDRVSARVCAGDPRTGRAHPPVDMVRDVEQRARRRPALEAAPPRRVLTADEFEALLHAPLPDKIGGAW
jgi:hypothetical protein